MELPDSCVEVEDPIKDNPQAIEVVELKFEGGCLPVFLNNNNLFC